MEVDFDFQYDTKIKTRQHDEHYIIDMVTIYNEEIRKIIKVLMRKHYYNLWQKAPFFIDNL